MNRRITSALRFAVICLVAACGDRGASPPSSPTVPTPPARNVTLAGNVYNTALTPVAGAIVEVVDTSGPGLSTTTNSQGRFEFLAPFKDSPLTVQVTKDGYRTQSQVVLPQSNRPGVPPTNVTGFFNLTAFYLEAIAPPLDLTGQYSLTLTADNTCSLPDDVRHRTYAASIAPLPPTRTSPANTSYRVTVTGAQLVSGYDTFDIFVAGSEITFAVEAHDQGLVEQIGSTLVVAILGDATTSVASPQSITTPMQGSFLVCESQPQSGFSCAPASRRAECFSTNHQLTLTRQ